MPHKSQAQEKNAERFITRKLRQIRMERDMAASRDERMTPNFDRIVKARVSWPLPPELLLWSAVLSTFESAAPAADYCNRPAVSLHIDLLASCSRFTLQTPSFLYTALTDQSVACCDASGCM